MRIKICGITNKEDAKLAEKNGAHAIGVIVNTETKRSIELEKAEKIFETLGPYTTKVCVTKNSSKKSLKQIEKTKADAIQIYSKPETQTEKQIIRAISKKEELKNENNYDAILLDKSHGTGKKFSINQYKTLISDINNHTIISGGINPQNIRSIMIDLNPYAIDVSSGVETQELKKDPEKIKKLLKRGINT